jgi:hypothetical protein
MNRRDVLFGGIAFTVGTPIAIAVDHPRVPTAEERAAVLLAELHSLFKENASKPSPFRLSWEIPFNGNTVSFSGLDKSPSGILML